MIAILNFLLYTKLGQAAAALALVAAMFGTWLLQHDHKVAKRAEEKVYVESKKAGKEANAKNAAVRRDAAQPGAAKRLLSDACRDC